MKQSLKIVAIAIASTLGLWSAAGTQTASANNGRSHAVPSKQVKHKHSDTVVTGVILVGPVESVLANGKSARVLGHDVDASSLRSTGSLLPAEYVAVYGSMSSDGELAVEWIEKLSDVYSPGSSTVFHFGKVTGQQVGTGVVYVADIAVDGLSIPGFASWVNSQSDSVFFIVGTQAANGSPIRVSSALAIDTAGLLGIDGTGISIHGIDGTGIHGIDGTGISIQGIDGTGISIQGIDGTGIQGIDGTGVQGIDGTGVQGIDGTGIQGIDGTGVQGIDGTGIQGIDGTGIQGIDGTGIQGIDGTGIQGIDGTGVQGIDGTGIQGIDGTGR
jgi:hypothetical protein